MKKNVFVIMVLCACLAGLSSCAFLKKTMNPCGDNPCTDGPAWRIMVESCKGDRSTNQVTVNLEFTRKDGTGNIYPAYKFVDDKGNGVNKARFITAEGKDYYTSMKTGSSINLSFTAKVSPEAQKIESLFIDFSAGNGSDAFTKVNPINNIPIVWE